MNRTPYACRSVVLLAVLVLVAACTGGTDGSAVEDEGTVPPVETSTQEDTATADDPQTAIATESVVATADDVATDVGVTEEPCPESANPDNGCIYLGVISDFTGLFSALGVPIAEATEAFWARVNAEGGIGGYDIDAVTYVRDNSYNPETHTEAYQEIEDEILALAMSLGSPTTAAIYDDLEANSVVTVPAGWTSSYVFQDLIIESGTSYCIDAMNAISWAQENLGDIGSVMAVYYPGDYGADAAFGARYASEELDLEFTAVETVPGQDNQAGAIDAVVSQAPDLVIIATSPTDMATIVVQAAAGGFQGRYVGAGPTWSDGLVQTPAFPALQAQYHASSFWPPYEADTPGHRAMREWLGETGNTGFTSGWVWQYPMKAALEAAVENGDLTRQGLLEAATSLESVDYEGMLPEGSGNYAAGEAFPRETIIAEPSETTGSGLNMVESFFTSDIAQGFDLTEPCHARL